MDSEEGNPGGLENNGHTSSLSVFEEDDSVMSLVCHHHFIYMSWIDSVIFIWLINMNKLEYSSFNVLINTFQAYAHVTK